MNIRLKHRYKGPLTGNVALQAGEYNGDDLPPGLAEYLVENDHAVVIGSNISRAIDVVQAASTEVKQAIAEMLSREAAAEEVPDTDLGITEVKGEEVDLSEFSLVELANAAIEVVEPTPPEVGVDMAQGDDATVVTEITPEDKPKKSRKK